MKRQDLRDTYPFHRHGTFTATRIPEKKRRVRRAPIGWILLSAVGTWALIIALWLAASTW